MRRMTKMTMTKLMLGAAAIAASSGAAAADMFLKFEDVKPTAGTAKMREAAALIGPGTPIAIMSWSWGASNSGAASSQKFGAVSGLKRNEGMGAQRSTVPAAADYDGDGAMDRGVKAPRDVATGQASGKRQHGEIVLTKQVESVGGSVSLVGKFPSCTVGAAYGGALLQAAEAQYQLYDVTVTGCGHSGGGGQPTNSLTMTYIKRKLL